MAKRKNATDDDFSQDIAIPVAEDFAPEEVTFSSDEELSSEEAPAAGKEFFEMGIILTDEDKDRVDEEFDQAAKKLKKPATEEDSDDELEEYTEEGINYTDQDFFLDEEENYDPDNYGYQDDL